MIEILFVSSITVVGMMGGVSCEFSQTVQKSSYTAAGQACSAEWEDYEKRESARCSGNFCYAVYIVPPSCSREKVVVWTREVGLCDDGVVRWRRKP